MISLAWERIRTYPATRSGSVAGNVVLDVRKQLWRATRAVPMAPGELTGASVGDVEVSVLGRLFLDALSALASASGSGARDVQLVLRSRLYGEGVAELAAEEGVSPRVLCQRRWRAETRLRAALGDWTEGQVMRGSAA